MKNDSSLRRYDAVIIAFYLVVAMMGAFDVLSIKVFVTVSLMVLGLLFCISGKLKEISLLEAAFHKISTFVFPLRGKYNHFKVGVFMLFVGYGISFLPQTEHTEEPLTWKMLSNDKEFWWLIAFIIFLNIFLFWGYYKTELQKNKHDKKNIE
jgi:hypothetical protein